MLKRLLLFAGVTSGLLLMSFVPSKHDKLDEGMYPLAQLNTLNLNKAGLQIPQSDIYQPGKVGLTNALVRLGGCTGSFISDQGLIITNHHCVFSAVAQASTPEKNYLDNGFYASNEAEEIKTALPCKITVSFDDVSSKVLEGITSETSPADRKKKIAENIKAITEQEQKTYPELKIEISEMFVGKYYTLFRYKMLDDVRLVYVPPKAVGKFGGESDNWMWPRHNGDFSIVRAYENGKPFTPEKYLKIDADGTKENDFVFILGYPGRTYRHYPAQFLTYQNEHILPLISSWFDERIAVLQDDAKGDKAKELRYAGTIASLSNTAKNFKGKMQGLQRTDILEQRFAEQKKLQEFVSKQGNKAWGDVIPQIEKLYKRKNELADDYILLNQMYSSSGIFGLAHQRNVTYEAYNSASKDEKADWVASHEKELSRLLGAYRYYNLDIDVKLFSSLVFRVYKNGNGNADGLLRILGVDEPTKANIYSAVQKMWSASKYADKDATVDLIKNSPLKFLKKKDKTQLLAAEIRPIIAQMGQEWSSNSNELDALMPKLADIKQAYYGGNFIPDANATLRLTYGYVKGYSPSDAVYNDPFTTIDGIIEKAQPEGDYYMPENILEKLKGVTANDNLKHPDHNQVVVGILYNMDTTGGNSGSPILNAKGELVGVNFDRAYSATINDFEWNESYSRSIGVDIRYVLYVMKYISEADAVLDELGVSL